MSKNKRIPMKVGQGHGGNTKNLPAITETKIGNNFCFQLHQVPNEYGAY